MRIRSVLLIDGIGAAVSALVTGLILPLFSEQLGLPPHILYSLAALALVFMIFSLFCYFIAREVGVWMLRVIIFANLTYCVISAGLTFFYAGVTSLGQAVLCAELLIVLFVVAFEIRVGLR